MVRLFAKRQVMDETIASKNLSSSLMHSKRKCRDLLCIPIFIAYWAGMVVVAYISYRNGDPRRLIFAKDYKGNICGTSTTSEGSTAECYANSTCGKFIAFPKLDEDLMSAEVSGILSDPTKLLKFPFHGVCREECPEADVDTNDDGEVNNWICDYDVMDEGIKLYGINPVNSEIPSADFRVALEECLVDKTASAFVLGANSYATSKTLSNNQTANCAKLMPGCRKMYAAEESLLFRCVAIGDVNATCAHSPYLQHIGETVASKSASDPRCGECLEPVLGVDGNPMDPSAEECRAKKVLSAVEVTEAAINPALTVGSVAKWLRELMGDIYNSTPTIALFGGVLPMLMGCIWLIFLRLAARIFVYTALYGLLACLAFLSFQFLIYGGVITSEMLSSVLDQLSNATGLNIDSGAVSGAITSVNVFENKEASKTGSYAALGYTLSGVTLIYMLLLFALHSRIRLAVAIIKEATSAIASMPLILIFPIFTALWTLILIGFASVVALYLVSMNDLTQINVTTTINITNSSAAASALQDMISDSFARDLAEEHSVIHLEQGTAESLGQSVDDVAVQIEDKLAGIPYLEIMLVFHLLGFYWTTQLIQAIGATTIAGAVGSWYWSTFEDGKKSRSMPRRPILKSLFRVFRYHLGSLIFGSFIVALVQLLRTILMYLDRQTQSLQKRNRVFKVIMSVFQCCLCILEKILKFITRNAFIYIALFGKNFCTSTKEVFKLIILNVLRIGVAKAVSGIIILLGKVLIVGVSCFLCTTVLSLGIKSSLGSSFKFLSIDPDAPPPSSIVPPVIVTGITAWYVSGCFLGVYGLTIDTILISLCVDEDKNDGSVEKPYYMTKSLKKMTKKWNKKAKKVDVKPNPASSHTDSSKSK